MMEVQDFIILILVIQQPCVFGLEKLPGIITLLSSNYRLNQNIFITSSWKVAALVSRRIFNPGGFAGAPSEVLVVDFCWV